MKLRSSFVRSAGILLSAFLMSGVSFAQAGSGGTGGARPGGPGNVPGTPGGTNVPGSPANPPDAIDPNLPSADSPSRGGSATDSKLPPDTNRKPPRRDSSGRPIDPGTNRPSDNSGYPPMP